jgi:transposase-like protein
MIGVFTSSLLNISRCRFEISVKDEVGAELRHHHPESFKVALLRRHLLEQVPVSELCRKHDLHPNVFYRWQKEFFEGGAAALRRSHRGRSSPYRCSDAITPETRSAAAVPLCPRFAPIGEAGRRIAFPDQENRSPSPGFHHLIIPEVQGAWRSSFMENHCPAHAP